MEEFCGSTFWDEAQVWHTSNPDFTPCFERTVLAWIPCAFILLTAGFVIYNAFQSKKPPISSTMLNICQMCLTVTLAVLMVTEFIASVSIKDVMRYPVDHVTPGVRAIAFWLAGILQVLNKRQGVPSSGFLFMFWFASVVCEVFSFRTQLRSLPIQYEYQFDAVRSIITLCSYPLIVIQVVLHFFSDTNGKNQKDGTDKIKPIEQIPPESMASFPSRMTFHWFWPLAYKGFKKSLDFTDLWGLNPEDKARNVIQKFNSYWASAVRNRRRDGEQVSILSSLIKSNWAALVAGILYRFLQDLFSFVAPFLLELLMAHVGSDDEAWKGYLYAALLFLTGMVQTILMAQHYHQMSLVGLRARSAIIGAVFEKSLLVSSVARKGSTLGEIVNLVSVDSQRFIDVTQYINEMWSAPLVIAFSLYFLWNTLGAAILGGLAVMILLVPLNIFIAKKNKMLQIRQMGYKDERSKLMNEIVSGIKVLKMYAWEPSFEMQIKSIRQKELSVLKTSAMLNAFVEFLWTTASFSVSLATFATYVLMDENNVLDARKAFVSLAYFNIMRRPMNYIPLSLGYIVTAVVSMKRVNKFLNLQEISPNDVTHDKDPNGDFITVTNGQFSWDQSPILSDINLNIKEGSLVAIVGPVGAGKTSLLSAVLGEMKKFLGTVNTDGSIAYVAQQAWIQNATARDNILFNSPYDAGKYQKIIGACALKPDFKIFPAGDRTEIGEKGINLSGGQKQRISLARAVYRDADIYLLDDPLSAVDAHVGKHLFDEVIGPTGILGNKTRLFVTHGMTYLPKVDAIVVMSNGRISQVGTFQELIKQKGPFSEVLNQNAVDEELDDDLIYEATEGVAALNLNLERIASVQRRTSQLEDDKQPERQLSPMSMRGEAAVSNDKLIAAELVETGRVKTEVYKHYLRSVSLKFAIPAVFLLVATQALGMGSSVWLSKWSSKSIASQTHATNTRNLYLGVYGAFGLAQGLASLFGNALVFIGCLEAAEFLHGNMLQRILRSPMSFFDTTPLGRVLNRFSKDVDVVDTTLPMSVQCVLIFGLQVMGILIIISFETPWFFVAIIPIGILYYTAQRFYLATSRQLKRMESQSRSPINSHFSETVAGAATIRAFGMQRQFIEHSENTVDNNQTSYYPSIVALRWLSVRLETISNLIVFFAALFAVMSGGEESSLGLSVSYALMMTQFLNLLVRMTSEMETNIVAVERMKEYGEVQQEAPWEVPGKRPQADWPVRGEITFDNYHTRYREGLDLVLRGVSCVIQPGEKIGIVGRTGAGKSSLTLGLFRIIEAAGGHIEIDGHKLSDLGLHDVRGKLTIIPQDPVLFSGSLRMNLDPFGKQADDELWHALECAHLKSFANSLPLGLDYVVTEGGDNLSVGQRQLVCLARALLWKTKILILDEATAAVDLQTDDLIQKTILTEFKECTVLTIAHRLNTIMDSNRVMVLDTGVIKEFASPQELLEKKTSIFYGMAKDARLV